MNRQRADGDCHDRLGPPRGQSETVGVLILTGVVVILVGIVGVFVVGNLPSDETPVATFEPTVTTQSVTLQHAGGDSIPKEDLAIVVVGTQRGRTGVASLQELDGDGDGTLEPGEAVREDRSISDSAVRIVVAHEPSGTSLYNRRVDVQVPATEDSISGEN